MTIPDSTTPPTLAPALAVARAAGAAVLAVGQEGDAVDALGILERCAQEGAAVVEGFGDDALRIGGVVHPAQSGPLAALGAAMRTRGIGTLTLRPGATRGELERLVAYLAAQAAEPPGASWGIRVVPAGRASLAAARALDAAYDVDPEGLLVATRAALAEGDASALAACARALATALERVGTGPGRLALAQVGRLLARPAAAAMLARYVTDGAGDAAIHAALARAGDDAVRLLLEALADAESLTERRACFDAIAAIDMGAGPLLDALADPRWFVVRNAALLLAELDVPGTESALQSALGHPDARVRQAVGAALLRRRTPTALAALQRVARDPSAAVRQLAARAYALGADARPVATALIAAFDVETDERVLREQLAALGRLATPDAIQRLVRFLTVPGPVPVPAWQQIAAIEALVIARGDAAVVTLRKLVDAPEAEVRAAARNFIRAVGEP